MADNAAIDLDEALKFAATLAEQAGIIARKHHSPEIAYDPKADNTPITQADTEINRLVVERCAISYPNVGVMGEEESSDGSSGSEWLWVCDPIDGTIPYMLGMKHSTFCLALVHDGVPVVGVVHDFMNERLYSALKGRGAWLNGRPLTPAGTRPLKLAELENWPNALDTGDLRERLFANNWQVSNFVAYAFTVVAVATGRIGGAIYAGRYAWDVAAAKVIAEELGCRVTDLDGVDQRYDGTLNGAVVAHPTYVEELARLVREARR